VYLTVPNAIERLTSAGVHISTFGLAGCSAADMGMNLRVAVSPLGPVYVADSQIAALRTDNYPSPVRDGVLHQFAPDGSNPAVYGTCPAPGTRTLFGQINDLAVGTGGRLYVADGITSSIDRIGPTGSITGVFAAIHPSSVATDRQGNYYVPDLQDGTIEQHGPNGQLLAKSTVSPVEATAIAPSGRVYALTAFGDVLVLPPIGQGNVPLRRWRMVGYAGDSGGLSPSGICLDGAGNIWVTDTRHSNIQKYSSSGRLLLMWGRGGSGLKRFQNPSGLAVDGRGHLFVLDTGNNRVQEYDLQGHFMATFGREGQAPGQLHAPFGIAADSSGAIDVGDRGNDRIQQLILR
jgi:DNA-binding beta-propeller fold protein YncE